MRLIHLAVLSLAPLWLSGCGDDNTRSATTATSEAPVPTWSDLRTTYKPLLTKNGVSKGCNFAPDQAQCFARLFEAAASLQSDIAKVPSSTSKTDVQQQISRFNTKYQAYLSDSSNRLEAMTLDISALGIWRALLQAQ